LRGNLAARRPKIHLTDCPIFPSQLSGVPVRTKAAPDDTLLKALARAHRWRRMLENGKASSINELAEIEKINASYISRILRLTFLAPDIVTAILNGRQPRTLQLADMLEDVPVEWQRQREGLFF
jgi:hypothetical protein